MFRIERTKDIAPGREYFQSFAGDWATIWTHERDLAQVFTTRIEAEHRVDFLYQHFPDDMQTGEEWNYKVE